MEVKKIVGNIYISQENETYWKTIMNDYRDVFIRIKGMDGENLYHLHSFVISQSPLFHTLLKKKKRSKKESTMDDPFIIYLNFNIKDINICLYKLYNNENAIIQERNNITLDTLKALRFFEIPGLYKFIDIIEKNIEYEDDVDKKYDLLMNFMFFDNSIINIYKKKSALYKYGYFFRFDTKINLFQNELECPFYRYKTEIDNESNIIFFSSEDFSTNQETIMVEMENGEIGGKITFMFEKICIQENEYDDYAEYYDIIYSLKAINQTNTSINLIINFIDETILSLKDINEWNSQKYAQMVIGPNTKVPISYNYEPHIIFKCKNLSLQEKLQLIVKIYE